MTTDFVVGIDVAGKARGYQCAVLGMRTNCIREIFSFRDPREIAEQIKFEPGNCRLIAVDSPPKASVESDKTRLAERQLYNDGYNVLWTPRRKNRSTTGEWMENGERLWNVLKCKFGQGMVIETFPTAASDGLQRTDVTFPLRLIENKDIRKDSSDFIDAAICSVVARKFELSPEEIKTYGESGSSTKYDDEDDALGLIHVLKDD